jgi:hypothetical protein
MLNQDRSLILLIKKWAFFTCHITCYKNSSNNKIIQLSQCLQIDTENSKSTSSLIYK